MRRVLTSLVLIPLVIYLVLLANWWLLGAVVALVACACFYEYRNLAAAYGFGAPSLGGFAFQTGSAAGRFVGVTPHGLPEEPAISTKVIALESARVRTNTRAQSLFADGANGGTAST